MACHIHAPTTTAAVVATVLRWGSLHPLQEEGLASSFVSKLVATKAKAYAAVTALMGILALVIDLIWEEAFYAHIGGLGL